MIRGVERITILRRKGNRREPETHMDSRDRKPRRERHDLDCAQWLEEFTKSTARSTSAAIGTYLTEHDQSNRRQRDGWLRDLPNNVWSAYMQGKRRFWRIGRG